MRRFGLIGRNIDYSFSRKFFSEKFNKDNINAEYRNYDLASIGEFPELIREEPLSGLNVTIPYKEEIISFLNNLDDHAERIKAVNTIKFEKDGSLTGYNTDYWGFMHSLKPHLRPKHSKALILGTGGASKAIAYALKLLAVDYKFVSRDPQNSDLSYEVLDHRIFGEYKLIINSTPLGTFPDIEESPKLNFELFTTEHLVFDLIYNPSETRLMKEAAARGATAINGLRMLELQAEKAWEIWNS